MSANLEEECEEIPSALDDEMRRREVRIREESKAATATLTVKPPSSDRKRKLEDLHQNEAVNDTGMVGLLRGEQQSLT